MKQRITEHQFNELSKEKEDIWIKWCQDRGYTMQKIYPLPSMQPIQHDPRTILGFPSIGEMIEFLEENRIKKDGWWDYVLMTYEEADAIFPKNYDIELCDALWEAVKGVLNR